MIWNLSKTILISCVHNDNYKYQVVRTWEYLTKAPLHPCPKGIKTKVRSFILVSEQTRRKLNSTRHPYLKRHVLSLGEDSLGSEGLGSSGLQLKTVSMHEIKFENKISENFKEGVEWILELSPMIS